MARDYNALTQSNSGVWVPRWLVIIIILIAAAFLAWSFLRQPTQLIQRLDSPDGEIIAVLKRVKYLDSYFIIEAKEGLTWSRLWTSGSFVLDHKVDRGERLSWSEDSRILHLKLKDEAVWGYDFSKDKVIRPQK